MSNRMLEVKKLKDFMKERGIQEGEQFAMLPLTNWYMFDDGFVSSPKKIVKLVNCSNDDLKLLIAKGFIIPFDSGIIAIRHWKLNNDLKKDRYSFTIY